MIIRNINSGNIPSLTYLVIQLGYTADEPKIRDRLSAIIDRNDHCVFTAEIDGEIVGFIHGFIAYRIESEAFVEIGGLVVDDKHRKQGVGKALVDEVIHWAKEKKIPKVRVRCNITRRDAYTFYESIGFEKKKQQNVFDKII